MEKEQLKLNTGSRTLTRTHNLNREKHSRSKISHFWETFSKVDNKTMIRDQNIDLEAMADKKCGTLHDFACHPCAGAMLIVPILVDVLPKQVHFFLIRISYLT